MSDQRMRRESCSSVGWNSSKLLICSDYFLKLKKKHMMVAIGSWVLLRYLVVLTTKLIKNLYSGNKYRLKQLCLWYFVLCGTFWLCVLCGFVLCGLCTFQSYDLRISIAPQPPLVIGMVVSFGFIHMLGELLSYIKKR